MENLKMVMMMLIIADSTLGCMVFYDFCFWCVVFFNTVIVFYLIVAMLVYYPFHFIVLLINCIYFNLTWL